MRERERERERERILLCFCGGRKKLIACMIEIILKHIAQVQPIPRTKHHAGNCVGFEKVDYCFDLGVSAVRPTGI